MRVLMINKFLYRNGGSETYILKLGEELERAGHSVQYFGMADSRNVVGNAAGAYTRNKEFRTGFSPDKLLYPFEILYSADARKKIRRVIEDFQPDIAHLNNIHFQITPSVILELKKYHIPMVWTAHDYQLVCPNHMLYRTGDGQVCRQCLGGRYGNCLKNRCLHGSTVKSALAMLESRLYRRIRVYDGVDRVICPSRFMGQMLETREEFRGKCVVLRNFAGDVPAKTVRKGDYILYVGRFDREKGIRTLVEVCKRLKHIPFIFAGSGELESALDGVENIENVGFQSGEAYEMLVRRAVATVCPSEWYENCPFSVIESLMYGVPVIGADLGGIPELIEDGKTGLLFESGNGAQLADRITTLWEDRRLAEEMGRNCLAVRFDDLPRYREKLLALYGEVIAAKRRAIPGCDHEGGV